MAGFHQLAHNVRDEKGAPKAQALHTFGRLDSLDVEAVKRLISSISRFASQEEMKGKTPPPTFERSIPLGGAHILRGLWEKLSIPEAPTKALKDRNFSSPVEWAIFAMVANRALSPFSKRGVEEWVREDVALGNAEPIALHHLYRAMDLLLEHREQIHKEVFFSVADLMNLEVDLLFFDTASAYPETDEEEGLKRYGRSKDRRNDLPQIIIGLAVAKEGIPVKRRVLPGNAADMKTVEKAKDDLRGWRLSRCVWAMDRGMSSEENRVALQKAGGRYILGEKPETALAKRSSPGREDTRRRERTWRRRRSS